MATTPLGCARHTAFIYDRGGKKRLGQIDPLVSVNWSRVRDDTSFANFTTIAPSWECQRLLANAEPNRHELVIFRDGERVWEGPLSLLTLGGSTIIGQARDITYYLQRTVCHAEYDNTLHKADTVIHRAKGMILAELARKESLDPPINVIPHVVSIEQPGDARTSRKSLAYSTTVFDDMDSMAAKSGLDYTVVGRSLVLVDTHTVFHTTAPVSEADFLDGVVISSYGMEGATASFVNDGQGGWGSTGGVDPYYGEWEIVDSSYETGSSTDLPTPTEMAAQALRNMSGRNPVPVVVRVPDNTQLSPNSRLRPEDLVPGVRIPLRATLTARTIAQMQKLDSVKFTETANDEVVTVTMSAASANDEDLVEEAV